MSVKEQLLMELENNKGSYISGGTLAKNLSVSRNSVWKAIKALEKDGYAIDAVTNKGYMLSKDCDIISAQSVSSLLKYPVDLEVYKEIGSTNALLKEYADQGRKEVTAVIAMQQSSGRGRMGKSFYSPEDSGIYLSILVRPDIPASESLFLTTSAAVAVSRAIEDLTGKNAGIKWVNDIYIDERKVCGILTEAGFNMETGKLDYAIVGIGVNVSPPKGGFPDDISEIAGAVFDDASQAKGIKSKLASSIINNFLDYYYSDNPKAYVSDYIERSILIGRKINIIEQDKIIPATANRIDSDCRLEVKLEDGTYRWLSSGEVSIRLK